MDSLQKLGLIGRNISYSFSKKYFENKFKELHISDCSYDIFDLQNIEEIETIFNLKNLIGFSVTIPYKEQIIPYLDTLSEEADKIGAVNCVAIQNGKRIGYNTDAFGFEKTLLKHKTPQQNSALVLGDGGAAKAVKFVLEKNHIPYKTVSRKSDINFESLNSEIVSKHPIIIQCTPVGTFPNVNDCVTFPFEGITPEHLVIDLIYNPEETQFMKNAKKNGASVVNGLYMLEQQAEKAWEIWNYAKKNHNLVD